MATLTIDAATARSTSAFSAHGWSVHGKLLGRDEHDADEVRAELGDPQGPLHRVRTLTVANGEPWILSSY